MPDRPNHPGLERIVATTGAVDALNLLADELAGSDLTTLLLEIARRRVDRLGPADVIAQYGRDRFVGPGTVDSLTLARLELGALESAHPTFDPVITSPLAPLGTHAVLGGVDQNNVITTVRGTEVAADPTTSLTLEAAARRGLLLDQDPKSAEPVRLSVVERVVRAQRFEGARSFAHFSLLGLVSAGRDRGRHGFEAHEMIEHLRVLIELLTASCDLPITIRVTDFDGSYDDVVDRVIDQTRSDRVTCSAWPERTAGDGYYPNLCFKLSVTTGHEVIELGDGGIVDWTQRLLQSRKERLMTSGLSLDRLAMLVYEGSSPGS